MRVRRKKWSDSTKAGCFFYNQNVITWQHSSSGSQILCTNDGIITALRALSTDINLTLY